MLLRSGVSVRCGGSTACLRSRYGIATNGDLTLARDRFGVKPLYWAEAGSCFFSLPKSRRFFACPGFEAAIDLEGLAEYLAFQNFFTDRTMFNGVQLLPAGLLSQVDAARPAASRSRFNIGTLLSKSRRDAAPKRTISKSSITCFSKLSPGNSSATSRSVPICPAAWIPARSPRLRRRRCLGCARLRCGFDLNSASGVEMGFDERAAAEYMSYVFKTEHYEMVLKAGDMERMLPKLAWHLEEPRVGQCYPNFYAAQLAQVRTRLCCRGRRGRTIRRISVALLPCGREREFRGICRQVFRLLAAADSEGVLQQRLRADWDRGRHVWIRAKFSATYFSEHAPSLTRPEDYINHSLYFEAKTFLNGLLVVEDKLSMAHGLETRVPFLDNDLVDFAMRLPAQLKLGNLTKSSVSTRTSRAARRERYFERTRDGKLLLRKMMAALHSRANH